MPRTSLLSHVVYFTAAQKRVFLAASKYSLTNLNAYIRDLLTRDVELRAEQGEPYFEGLRDELREAAKQKEQAMFGSESSTEAIRDTLIKLSKVSHGVTEDEQRELAKRGIFSESSGKSIRAALKEIRNANGNEKEI